jgi:hypothetical protein
VRELPQVYGPRHVLIGDRGEVLLLDEWINRPSEQAIELFNRRGNLIARYPFDRIPGLVNKSPATVAESARSGAWIGSEPILEPDKNSVKILVADKILRIDLSAGKISVN